MLLLMAKTSESGLRVHVFLARLGLGSRREIEALIEAHKVQVNGRRATLGQKIQPEVDRIRLKGKEVYVPRSPRKSTVLAFHKPRGVLSTKSDPERRTTIMDFLPRSAKSLFPVGRLDLNSEGLILLTNDGELALRLTHPRYEVSKVYEVKIRGNLTDKKIKHLERGVLVENEKYKPAEILSIHDVTKFGVKKFTVVIKVFEGKNHHVRKLFEALACHVIRLKRISMGSISLKGIPRGEYRVVSDSKIRKLREEFGLQEEASSQRAS